MNETERRRKQLLEETRRKYVDSRTPPAVHPRYEAIYSDLYEENSTRNDGFFFSHGYCGAVVCFVCSNGLQWRESGGSR